MDLAQAESSTGPEEQVDQEVEGSKDEGDPELPDQGWACGDQ